jgi:hypothetical protein
MSSTVAERILVKVAERLEAIKVADGYEIDVLEVLRARRFDNESPRHLQCTVSLESLTPSDQLSHMGNPPAQGWDMVVRCGMIVTPPEDDHYPADDWRLVAYGAMSKAITAPTAWYHWDGLAVNSQILAPEFRRTAEQGQIGTHLLVNIQFLTDENDPYQVRL